MPNPATHVNWYTTTLDDTHPTLGKLSFTVPWRMDCMLTDVAPKDPTIRGRGPDNTALWWPYFKKRHKVPKFSTFWVQGHLLNDNVWGPGDPRNLLPISNALNTNMLNLVEVAVKKYVNQGKILRYVVQGHWDQTPAKTREVFGLVDDNTGSLLWGEQFAPTRLSWEIYELGLDPLGKLLQSPLLHGSDWYSDKSQWNNNFPQ
jgi:hypothetical protein